MESFELALHRKTFCIFTRRESLGVGAFGANYIQRGAK